jgi:Flp pilus assembly protein TadB
VDLSFWLAIVLCGLAAAAAARALLRPEHNPDEPARVAALRGSDVIYRHLGGWVERAARRVPEADAAAAFQDLRLAAETVPWSGAEFVARSQVAGWVWGAGCGAVLGVVLGWIGAVVGVGLALAYPGLVRRSLAARAAARLARIRGRLPLAIELLVAQLTAGAGPTGAIRSVAIELAGHPVSDELDQLARAVEGGRTLAAAARESVVLQADPDLRQVAAELARGEDHGLALVTTFRTITRQLRERDAALAQKRAEEARAKLVGPVLLVALACVLVIVVPFLLHAFEQY